MLTQGPADSTLLTERPVYTKKDCLANNGIDYTGDLSVTMQGSKCLPWTSPKAVAISKGKDFVPEVKLIENHCRNPDGDMEGPWCYVDNGGNITVGYCDLLMCGELSLIIISRRTVSLK